MTSDMELYDHIGTFYLMKHIQRGQRRQSEASCMDFSLVIVAQARLMA